MSAYTAQIYLTKHGGGSAQRDLIGARGGFSTNIIIKHGGGGGGSVANNLL